ncbi:hypothetical protein AVEN_150974-1 [Araneus ventricosus]|uniref:Tc1-like transposase DDE domain-containing protein n=1 Tax=Araneus ventricosus TaxID=182803 RepID=A0A4Y2SKQ3_ARAVE|nr:hypothetical protein AVEN_150974-1 [Araneus ventricosus]
MAIWHYPKSATWHMWCTMGDSYDERRLRICVRTNRRATVEQLTAPMNQGATKSVSSTHLSLRTMSTPTCELLFLRMMASTSRTMRGVIQLAVYVRGSTWPANSPDLNPIENLWDYLDRVVRAMDPHPRNLAQLATALESAWLNIPVNTFRNLIDSLPARLAEVRSAKGGYSGF